MATATNAAYPWRDSRRGMEDETAPGGPDSMPPRLEKRRTDAEIKEEYGRLKEAGMPLESMKLVLNEDLSALNEDATHVLGLNERLTRYALYVSQLERSNKELGAQVETLMAQLATAKNEFETATLAFNEERAGLLGKVAGAEAQVADSLLKVEAAEKQTATVKRDLQRSSDGKQAAESRVKTMEGAAEELRQIMVDNGIAVPKHLAATALAASSKRDAFASMHGGAAERMLDAAIANSDSARIALRVAALQDKGIEPPVDEAVMEEMLRETLDPEELRVLLLKSRSIGLEALVARRISPGPAIDNLSKMLEILTSGLTTQELAGLEAQERARETQMLSAYGVSPPLDSGKMAEKLRLTLGDHDARALYARDRAARSRKLESKNVLLPDSASALEIETALKTNLSEQEYDLLEASIVATHVQELAGRGASPAVDMPGMMQLLRKQLTPVEQQQLADAAMVDKVEMMLRKSLSVPVDDEKLDQLLRMALSAEDYEGVSALMRHEKMSALAAKGKMVPVDETKLQALLEMTLSPSELSALQASEYESSYNSARAAIRLEKLLEKNVPLSDELVIGCQRGEPWAVAELDRLVREHLSPSEVEELLATEEMVMSMVFEESGDGVAGGGGGGGNARVGSSSSRGAADVGSITREEAAMEQQSLLLDVQTKMDAEYLTRLADSSAALRATLQSDLDKEQQARREAQARNLALLDAVENQRARNAELMAKLAEHEARELERLRQLETMQTSREVELDAFRLQAERAIQDAAEAKAAREQLERAINQYEKILDAIGITRSIDKSAGAGALTTRAPKPGTSVTGQEMVSQSAGAGVSYSDPSSFGAGVGQRAPEGGDMPRGGGGMAMGGGGMAGALMSGSGMAPGGMTPGGGLVLGADEGITVASALPPHLLQLEKFVLLTDEGAVAVRARFNGTVGYLKRQVATQLHISPRLALTITASSSTIPLNDDAIISPYADGQGAERLLLSAAPRPLSDFFPGAPSLPSFRQLRVRPLVRGVPQNFSVVVKGVTERTSVWELQQALSKHPSLLPTVEGKPPATLALYFSPVFITPDVLLGRKTKQVLKGTQTFSDAQLIDDDILYLNTDVA